MKKKWMVALMTALVLTGCRTFTSVDEKSALQDFQSTDPIVREAARMKLEKSGSKRAIETMGTAYKTAVDSNWKLALINGLGAIKKPEIVHYLLPMPEDANLAAATVKATRPERPWSAIALARSTAGRARGLEACVQM